MYRQAEKEGRGPMQDYNPDKNQRSLTEADFDLLIEALDCWEANPISTALVSGMMSALLMSKKELKTFQEEQMQEVRLKVKLRKRQSLIVKAKLQSMSTQLS